MVINLVKHFPIMKDEVKDNLTSTDTNLPLSANQGKVLDGKKVNIAQGVENAGKYLAVSQTGDVTLVEDFRKVYGFKIPYASKSDNIEYIDYAIGMTEAQRRALVQSWAKHAVVKDGVIQYWLDETDLEKKADGTTSVLDGTDGDVMLLYKPIWWKVSHVDNQYTTVQFADFDFDPGHTATAHRYGEDKICSYLGLGVFEGIVVDSALRSINSTSNPTVSKTNDAFYTAATYGRTTLTNAHYNQMLPLTWTLYAILLLFEGGDRNTQAKWGNGLVSLSAASPVNKDWDATSAWYSSPKYTDGTHGVTAGGVQNMWGNVWKFFGEFLKETDNVAHFTVRGGADHQMITTAGNPTTWASVQMLGAQAHDGYVMDVIGDNNLPFLPRTKGGGSGTYWADYCYSSNSRNCGVVGSRWSGGATAGLFRVDVINAVSYSGATIGARLQVLID